MTDATWKLLANAIGSLRSPPPWLNDFTRLTYGEMSVLPKPDDVRNGHFSAPRVEKITIREDYLDFLREQIKLSPRGPEWTKVLQGRLDALVPFLGQKVYDVNLFRKPDFATFYVDPRNGDLIHAEVA